MEKHNEIDLSLPIQPQPMAPHNRCLPYNEGSGNISKQVLPQLQVSLQARQSPTTFVVIIPSTRLAWAQDYVGLTYQ